MCEKNWIRGEYLIIGFLFLVSHTSCPRKNRCNCNVMIVNSIINSNCMEAQTCLVLMPLRAENKEAHSRTQAQHPTSMLGNHATRFLLGINGSALPTRWPPGLC